jgi:hypothetical protein
MLNIFLNPSIGLSRSSFGLICSAVKVNLVCDTDAMVPISSATSSIGMASRKTFKAISNAIPAAIYSLNPRVVPANPKKSLKSLSNLTNMKPTKIRRNKKVRNIPIPLVKSLL